MRRPGSTTSAGWPGAPARPVPRRLRVRGAMACVALAPIMDDAVGAGESADMLAKGIGEHLGVALARTARASDVIGHLGRAEFAVIAPATTPEGAERLMERLQQALEAILVPIGKGSRAFTMRGSYFAVPDYSEASIHVLEMLERASSALHATRGLADFGSHAVRPRPSSRLSDCGCTITKPKGATEFRRPLWTSCRICVLRIRRSRPRAPQAMPDRWHRSRSTCSRPST